MCKQFTKALATLIRARSGLVWVSTNEERRAQSLILAKAGSMTYRKAPMFRNIYTWSSTTGLVDATVDEDDNPRQDLATLCKNPIYGPLDDQADGIFEYLASFNEGPALVIMKDLSGHIAENSPNRLQGMRMLKDLANRAGSSGLEKWVQIVVIDKTAAPEGFLKVDLELPTREELTSTVLKMAESTGSKEVQTPLDDEEHLGTVIDALIGLEDHQAQQALAVSLAEKGKVDPEVLIRSKKDLLKSDALEWIDPIPGGMDAIGGLDLLKDYFEMVLASFRLAQREEKTPRPKGSLVAGIPGTGKSLSAKVVGAAWGLPLIRLNIGALFGKYQGESEGAWRQARQVVEAIAPCVLWIDEIEKGLQGFGGGGSDSDGGTTARMGQDFLTWLAECEKPVYIFATANNPLNVPPEFFRAGRFDSKFWVDVPNTADRVSVLQVVGKKWRSAVADKLVDELGLDYAKIARHLEGFSGAELEQAMVEAVMKANYKERAPTEDDVIEASKMIQPVVKIWENDKNGRLEKVREWGQNQRQANDPNDPKEVDKGGPAVLMAEDD